MFFLNSEIALLIAVVGMRELDDDTQCKDPIERKIGRRFVHSVSTPLCSVTLKVPLCLGA